MDGGTDGRLVVSLSGVGPRTLHRCAEFATELDTRKVPLSLLFAPRTEHAVVEWMRTRAERGDSVLLHGYDHRVLPGHRIALGRNAEFATLPAHEARLRLVAATAALDRAGLVAEGFAPPRWLASSGTLDVLRARGFRFCADIAAVHDLRTGATYRARVQQFGASHQRAETVRCFALLVTAARAARRGGMVRLGVDATDLARPGRRRAFLDAVDVAVENRACPTTYDSLVALPSEGTTTSVPSGARLVNNP